MAELHVYAVNARKRIVLLSNDELVPITDLFFFDHGVGDVVKTDDHELATGAVAGPSKSGHWWAVDLREYDTAGVN